MVHNQLFFGFKHLGCFIGNKITIVAVYALYLTPKNCYEKIAILNIVDCFKQFCLLLFLSNNEERIVNCLEL